MATTKKVYRQYLEANFKGQKINKPLFFNGEFGLRFDLQVGETNTDEYFEEVIKRATALFEASFSPDDKVFLIYRDYKWRKRKIRLDNYCFKQLADFEKSEISFSVIPSPYQNGDRYNVAIIKLMAAKIHHTNILTAIAQTDFPPRKPCFKSFGSVEIYFININRALVFHMYDDRGLDIIAGNIETLKPIYEKFNSWILDSNREQIDKMIVKKKPA